MKRYKIILSFLLGALISILVIIMINYVYGFITMWIQEFKFLWSDALKIIEGLLIFWLPLGVLPWGVMGVNFVLYQSLKKRKIIVLNLISYTLFVFLYLMIESLIPLENPWEIGEKVFDKFFMFYPFVSCIFSLAMMSLFSFVGIKIIISWYKKKNKKQGPNL